MQNHLKTKFKTVHDIEPKFISEPKNVRGILRVGCFPEKYNHGHVYDSLTPRQQESVKKFVSNFDEYCSKGKCILLTNETQTLPLVTVIAFYVTLYWFRVIENLYPAFITAWDVSQCFFQRGNSHGDPDTIWLFQHSKFVVLADFDNITGINKETFNSLLSKRLRDGLTTIVITSLDSDFLKEVIGNSNYNMLLESNGV